MKRKHLFMTMALAAGFAACTSEDVIETSYTNEAARTVLDNIEFTIGEAGSRFTLDGGWQFDEGDAFGAALVDVTASIPSGSRAIDKYLLQNTIQSNYQYAYGDGGVWTTPARLVEGNYVFYAPFNEKHLSRKPIEVITPIAQTLDVNDGTVDAYSTINNAVAEGNPFFLAYEFLPAVGQETRLSLDFYSIFAYPKVTIKNNKKDDVTLTKVVINTGSDKFPVKAPLKVGSIDKVASNGVGGVVGNLFNVESDVKKQGAWYAKNEDTKDNGLVGATTDVLGTIAASANVIVVDIPNDLVIPAGESVSFNVVMPAQKYTDVKVLAYINNDEGYEIELDETMTFHPNKLYPTQEYKNDNTINQSKKGSLFTATITKNQDTEELADAFPILVATTDELIDAVLDGNSALYVIPTSEDVEINEDVFEAMRKVKFQGMTVAGDIKIVGSNDATKPLVLNEEIAIEGTATVNGYVKTSELATLTNVYVEEDATFSVAASAGETASVAAIVNYGTANIDDDASATKVTNYGVLNINAKEYTGSVAEGKTVDANENVTYYGTVNVKADNKVANTKFYSVWNLEKTVDVASEISVYGDMTVAAGATLKGEQLNVEGGATLNLNGTLFGKVVMKGVVDKDKTDLVVFDPAYATMNLGSASFLSETFEAGTNTVYMAGDLEKEVMTNIVNVTKGASFFSQNTTAAEVASWFVYDGNLDEETVGELKVPAVCNSLKINGNIIPSEGDVKLSGLTNVTRIDVTGSIIVKEGKIVDIRSKKLNVAGDVMLASAGTLTTDNLNLTNVDLLSIGGTLDMKTGSKFCAKTIDVAKFNNVNAEDNLDFTGADMRKMTVAGRLSSKGNITWTKSGADLILKNAEVIMASGKTLEISNTKLHIEGDVEFNGGIYGIKKVTVYRDAVWSIESNVRINNSSNKVLEVSRSYYDGFEGALGNVENGMVINEGTVYAAVDYDGVNADKTPIYSWWTGTCDN